MQKLRVGVLRGGPSSEYEVSLNTGAEVLANLPRERYEPIDVFIDRKGAWHWRGMPVSPERALNQIDLAFLALHGTYGEDGTVQRLLQSHGIPFTGSDAYTSALAMNKALTKNHLKQAGASIRMPAHLEVHIADVTDQFMLDLFRSFPQPCVIKPRGSGSSVGVTIATSFDKLREGFERAKQESPYMIVEEFIPGREATCGVVEKFRDEDIYALPEIEIIPDKKNEFFDYEAKYEGASQEICPGNFDQATKQELARIAREVHKTLGLRHYSRSDFVVSPRGVYFLEVNTLPGLTKESLVPKAVSAVGSTFPGLLEHLVTLAKR